MRETLGWFVYMVSNNARTLYTGMTNDLAARIREHKNRTFANAFTARYTFDRLVWFEWQSSKTSAARREHQIKKWRRKKRVALIAAANPKWDDLSVNLSEALLSE